MSDRRWGDTTSKKGEVSRVFVGNLDNSVVCDELENKFKRYGKIIGIDINSNGFGFIQFDQVEDAKRAVQNEVGTMLKGRKIECRMFDKSGSKKRGGGRDRSRSPVNRRKPFDNQPRGGGGMGSGPGPMFNASGPPPMIGMGMGGGLQSGPMNPSGQQQVNDVEIIVISKDQWAFAEMVERKIRQETGIKFIDILFLHSPQHISMTLNDLFERRTLYAVVIAPENEEHQTMTVHVLHNQMEYRNIPVDKAVGLISEDYQKFTFSSGGQQPSNSGGLGGPLGGVMGGLAPVRDNVPVFNVRGGEGVGSASHQRNGSSLPPSSQQLQPVVASSQDKRLPEDVAYVLRTTLTEGGVQFLSLQQIDTVIDYFSRERDRMTSQSRHQQQQQPLPPLPVQQPSVPYVNNSTYPGHPSSIYGPGIGQQNNSAPMHQQHNMDKVPDVLKLVQESDVLQKLLAGVIPSGTGSNSQSSGPSHPHHDQSTSMHQGYNVGNSHSIGAAAAGLNATRRIGSNDLGGLSRPGGSTGIGGSGMGSSGIGGADRGYGSRF